MNLLVLSDLHLEFSTLDIDTTGVDVIVLAGDIHLGKRGMPWIEAQSRGLPVIYVPGNHEFYKGEHSRVLRDLRAACAATSNVHLLDIDKITIGNVEFLGATLWTDFALYGSTEQDVRAAESYATRGMTDFTGAIRFETRGLFRKLQPRDTRQMHIAARQWLSNELTVPSQRKRVVVTHHAPSARSVPLATRMTHSRRRTPVAWMTSSNWPIYGFMAICTRVPTTAPERVGSFAIREAARQREEVQKTAHSILN